MRTELAEAQQLALQGSVKRFYAMQYPNMHYIRTMLIYIHNETKSWRQAGDYYGISGSMARMIANGYEPGKRIRKLLGVTRYTRRPRRAINLADPASAAATIRAHAGEGFVSELVRLLEEG